MNDQERRDELRRFLQDRRSRIAPADVGLASIGRRRVSGLRREEVAILAGIGVSWYTALESGENRRFSQATVLAVADALRLTDSERKYILSLVATPGPIQDTEPPSQLILDAMNASVYPSCVNSAEWDVLACNEAFRRIWAIEESECARTIVFPSGGARDARRAFCGKRRAVARKDAFGISRAIRILSFSSGSANVCLRMTNFEQSGTRSR